MNILGFLKMKYNQFIWRECERLHIADIIANDAIYKLDHKNDELEMKNLRLLQRIDELEEKLYFYEPWEGEDKES
jgi:hypothetical protein